MTRQDKKRKKKNATNPQCTLTGLTLRVRTSPVSPLCVFLPTLLTLHPPLFPPIHPSILTSIPLFTTMASTTPNSRSSWKVNASIISKRTSNPIRAIVDHIKVKPNVNKSMISLALGDPTLFGNFKIHQTCTDAVAKQLHSYKSNGYPPSTGYLHARQAVADKFTLPEAPLTAQDVIITSGCSGALDMCIGVLCNEGDNILLPRPGFSLYQTLADSKGIEVRYYDLLVIS